MTEPLAFLPALPFDGLVSDTGKSLGGFPACSVSSEQADASVEKWEERLLYLNDHCSQVFSSKGLGRRPLLEPRATAVEQAHGNIALNLTFALRHGSMAGLDPVAPCRLVVTRVGTDLTKYMPGVKVGGGVVHPPNPFVDDAQRALSGWPQDRAAGMNLHTQYYMYRAFAGYWLTPHHHGSSAVENWVVASLQHHQLGLDVHWEARVHAGVHFEWCLRAAPTDLAAVGRYDRNKLKRVSGARNRIKKGRSTIADEVFREMEHWDEHWLREGKGIKNQLQLLKWRLAKAKECQGVAVNWLIGKLGTRHLKQSMLEVDPRWAEHLDWGRKAALAVLKANVEERFQTPLFTLLERYEAKEIVGRARESVLEKEAELRLVHLKYALETIIAGKALAPEVATRAQLTWDESSGKWSRDDWAFPGQEEKDVQAVRALYAVYRSPTWVPPTPVVVKVTDPALLQKLRDTSVIALRGLSTAVGYIRGIHAGNITRVPTDLGHYLCAKDVPGGIGLSSVFFQDFKQVKANLGAKSFEAEAGTLLTFLRSIDQIERLGSELDQATAAVHRAVQKAKARPGDEAYIVSAGGTLQLSRGLLVTAKICARDSECTISEVRHTNAKELLDVDQALKALGMSCAAPKQNRADGRDNS